MVSEIWTYDWHKYFHPYNIKINVSYQPFAKYDIFEVTVDLPPIVTPIGIIEQHCKNNNMPYISQSTKNIPWNHYFTAQNRTNVWVLIIFGKEPKTDQQVLEVIPSQQPTVKCNRVNVITPCRYNNNYRKNIQENIPILN